MPIYDYQILTLNELSERAHNIAKEHGFYDDPISPHKLADFVSKQLCLLHSEISEALEQCRDGQFCMRIVNDKPEGFGVEIADLIIRALDLCRYLSIDIDKCVRLKMNYNATRPFKHGHKNF